MPGNKTAAIGIRMHSGWGVLVSVSAGDGEIEILDRRRVEVMDPAIPGAKQPYHFAARLELGEAEEYLATCTRASTRLALTALDDAMVELRRRECRLTGAAMLLPVQRPLPPLDRVLRSHALIHTAEGEFFRGALVAACGQLALAVTGFPERAIEERAKQALGDRAPSVLRRLSALGRKLGPPWTADHKSAALAAAIVVSR